MNEKETALSIVRKRYSRNLFVSFNYYHPLKISKYNLLHDNAIIINNYF